MEPVTETFCFSAQQTPRSDGIEGLGANLGIGISSKRARADNDSSGRTDFDMDNLRKEGNGISGSCFEILSEEVEASNCEDTVVSDTKYQEGIYSIGKNALDEITNISRKQANKAGKGIKKSNKKIDKLGIKKTGSQCAVSFSVGGSSKNGLSQDQFSPLLNNETEGQESMNGSRSFQKEDSEVGTNCEAVRTDSSKLGVQNTAEMHIDRFDAVASNLEEVMATISE
ncbi:hypothetical protein LWI29_024014 [Acer saccharum]|uniref:Uncharacterized protein n=1 Tax=Acer saccharum TaxID=4024 RepID=A0AA39VA72_ACESA|nr:hypothetical protein LWI29_024014 [Acer saccharum]